MTKAAENFDVDTLGWLAKGGKDFGKVELAAEKKALVQMKAQGAIEALRMEGISASFQKEPLSYVLRLAGEQRARATACGADVDPWDDILHTVGLVKYYVALANGESPTTGDEDTLVTDMDEDVLRTVICPTLNTSYLEPTTEAPVWPANKVDGILWGNQSRPFYALTVSTSRGQLVAPFFSNSGSRGNYLNKSTFAALGWTELIPHVATVRIHGYSTQVARAVGTMKGINTIGAEFKRVVGGIETLDYTQDKVQLMRTNPGA